VQSWNGFDKWVYMALISLIFTSVFLFASRWVYLSDFDIPPDYVSLDSAPNLGPLISCWELDTFKNFWNKSFITSKILTHLYQQCSNLFSQRDKRGPRLGVLSNKRLSRGTSNCKNLWTNISLRIGLKKETKKYLWKSFLGSLSIFSYCTSVKTAVSQVRCKRHKYVAVDLG
jgi:hypothetical protein